MHPFLRRLLCVRVRPIAADDSVTGMSDDGSYQLNYAGVVQGLEPMADFFVMEHNQPRQRHLMNFGFSAFLSNDT